MGALAGCYAHVDLEAPSVTADSRERLEAWERLNALEMKETHITYVRNGIPIGAARQTDYLQLAGGSRVYHPEDLRPVVAASSPTSAAIDGYESASAVATRVTIGGAVFAGIGVGVALTGLALGFDNDASLPLAIGGAAAAAVGGLVAAFVSGPFRSEANDEKSTAFVTYNRALQDRLQLCIDDKKIVPCDEPGAPESEPAPKEAGRVAALAPRREALVSPMAY